MDLSVPLPTEKDIPHKGFAPWPEPFVEEWLRQLALFPGRLRWGQKINGAWDHVGNEIPYNQPNVIWIHPMAWMRRVMEQIGTGASQGLNIQAEIMKRVWRKVAPVWEGEEGKEKGKKLKKTPSYPLKNPYYGGGGEPWELNKATPEPSNSAGWTVVWGYLWNEIRLVIFLKEWLGDLKRRDEINRLSVSWEKGKGLGVGSIVEKEALADMLKSLQDPHPLWAPSVYPENEEGE